MFAVLPEDDDALMCLGVGGQRTGCTLPACGGAAGGSQEVLVAQALTNTNRTDSVHSNPNLVSGLFFEQEFDADLRTVIEAWPRLSKDIRAAILRIAER